MPSCILCYLIMLSLHDFLMVPPPGPQLWGATPTHPAGVPDSLGADPARRGFVCVRGPARRELVRAGRAGRGVAWHHAQHLGGRQLRCWHHTLHLWLHPWRWLHDLLRQVQVRPHTSTCSNCVITAFLAVLLNLPSCLSVISCLKCFMYLEFISSWDEAWFKGLVHPKMKILSLITHPYVVPKP